MLSGCWVKKGLPGKLTERKSPDAFWCSAKGKRAQKQALMFMTGHACFVNFRNGGYTGRQQPIALNTVREPLARYNLTFNYGLYGPRRWWRKQKNLRSIRRFLGDGNITSKPSFLTCLADKNCVNKALVPIAMKVTTAFTACEDCSQVVEYPTSHPRQLAMVEVLLTQYNLVIPVEMLQTGLSLLSFLVPAPLGPIFATPASDALASLRERAITQSAPGPVDDLRTLLTPDQKYNMRRLESLSGDRLLYDVAVAKFCAELTMTSPLRSRNESLCTNSSSQPSKRYLIVIDGGVTAGKLSGGLHNQMMALQAQINLADALNRTLVLPLLTSSTPRNETKRLIQNDESIAFWELFSVDSLKRAHPRRSSENWVVSLDDVHGSAFLRRTTVSVSVAKMKSFDAAPLLHQHHHVDFLVANNIDRVHPLRTGWLSHARLDLSRNGRRALRKVLCRLSQSGTGDGCQASAAPHFIAIQMRIESGWLMYEKGRKTTEPMARPRFLEEIQAAFRKWFTRPRDFSAVPLYLSFDDEHLPPDILNTISNSILEGWPADVRVFTNAAFRTKSFNFSYIETSAIARELCLSAAHFIGNSLSSFTEAISLVRHAERKSRVQSHLRNVTSRDYIYIQSEGRIIPTGRRRSRQTRTPPRRPLLLRKPRLVRMVRS